MNSHQPNPNVLFYDFFFWFCFDFGLDYVSFRFLHGLPCHKDRRGENENGSNSRCRGELWRGLQVEWTCPSGVALQCCQPAGDCVALCVQSSICINLVPASEPIGIKGWRDKLRAKRGISFSAHVKYSEIKCFYLSLLLLLQFVMYLIFDNVFQCTEHFVS